jgi:hypothetical protein
MSKTLTNAPPRTSPPWSTDLVGAGAAVVCVLVTWLCTAYLPDLELAVRRGGEVQQIGWPEVALTAAVVALAGLAALRLLERLTPRALTAWTVLAVVVALVSFLGPLAATTTAATGTLLSMHAVVAAVVIASARASRRRRRTVR